MSTVEQSTIDRIIIEEVNMHKAKILAIHCIDLRFQEMIDRDLQQRAGYGKFDRISIPGASIDFEVAKKYALVSLQLHNPDEVLIYEHEECGAYGEENSNDIHKANAQKLADALIQEKPDLKVQTLIATFNGIRSLS